MTRSYVAIAEGPTLPGESWWISFPEFPGVTSAAATVEEIQGQARDALASAIEALQAEGQAVPPPIEEAALPAYDLGDCDRPLVLLIADLEMVQAD
jgi:predicted RNase H-like HicB family nuclease